MKLIKPSYKILEQEPGIDGIYKIIEQAGRTCYKSEDKITKDSAKEFVDKMIKSGHGAMLEHGTVYLKFEYIAHSFTKGYLGGLKYNNNPYSKVVIPEKKDITQYVTTNLRVLVENDWLNDLQYICEPTEYHEKRVTVKFTTDQGVLREFTRHRTMSFAVESTRYCNYSKNKFNNELTFIQPCWYSPIQFDNVRPAEEDDYNMAIYYFQRSLAEAEERYLELIKRGWKAQEARNVLPLATKCDIIMTGFVSDWKNFFDLRALGTTGLPHPQAKELAYPLYEEFVNRKLI